jgi:hypothetical protein
LQFLDSAFVEPLGEPGVLQKPGNLLIRVLQMDGRLDEAEELLDRERRLCRAERHRERD